MEIAKDILANDRASGHILTPSDDQHGADYRKAFEKAWRALDENLPKDKPLFPYQQSSAHDSELIEELGMNGCKDQEHVMRILRKSGAFTNIDDMLDLYLKKQRSIRERSQDSLISRKDCINCFPTS